MKLTYLDVLLILAFITEYIQTSRIKATVNPPANYSQIHMDSVLKERDNNTADNTNNMSLLASQDIVNQSTSPTTNETFATNNDKIITNDNNTFRSFLTNQAPETTTNVNTSFNNINAINLFAQRISHNIFQINGSKDADKTPTTELTVLRTLIWSPLSTYHSLVPLYYAAGGETKEELRELLLTRAKSMQLDDANEGPALTSLPLKEPDLNSSEQTFSSVTGLFVRDDVPLNPDYVQELQKNVRNVEVKSVDFHNSANAMKNINSWVVESTQGLIKEAVDETQVGPNMFMMIVNCVRFKASWQTRFDTKLTTISDFHGVNGVQKVQMMKQTGTQKFAKFPIIYSSDHDYSKNANDLRRVPFSVLEMPYADNVFTSYFILPDNTAKIQETLEYVGNLGMSEIRQMLEYVDVEVWMPKFKVKSDVNVEEALFENGLKTLFDPEKANFTKLIARSTHNKDGLNQINKIIPVPYLSNIIHRTIFETSEEGTTAAALTALSIVPLSALSHDRVFSFKLDRPFIVLLVDNNNTIVFQGIIADLNGQEIYETINVVDKNNNIDKESSNSVNKKNVLVYPSENESRKEIDKLIHSASENQHSFSEPLLQSFQETPQEMEMEANQTTDDRAWWIPNKIPEYLNPNNTTSLNVSNAEIPKDEGTATNSTTTSPVASTSKAAAVEPISFSKYQQPEPKDPTGIRFPATIQTIPRNKVIIKPRYENNEHLKNSLVKWMTIY